MKKAVPSILCFFLLGVLLIITPQAVSAQNDGVITDSLDNMVKLDTISIIYGDSTYYKEITVQLFYADGRRATDQTRYYFKDSNPDAYYIIHPGEGPTIEFEGRIKPGKKYHGRCVRYYNQSKQIRHLASETYYFNGKKHGREVHYKRNGKINWAKHWNMGEPIPNIEN